MGKIRLAIVEDQTLVREGLASLLGLQTDIDVVGKAADGASAWPRWTSGTPTSS
jgi:DNA-binding NarL/FixJ family response regulator